MQLILHANLTQISSTKAVSESSTRCCEAWAAGASKQRGVCYVLATGGLETPRILLANRDRHRPASATGTMSSDAITCATWPARSAPFSSPARRALCFRGYRMSPDGVYCRQRFALEEVAQRREGIGNFIARLHHPRITDPAHRSAILSLLYLSKPLIPFEYRQRLHGPTAGSMGDWMRHCTNVLAGPFEAAGFAWHMVRDRMLAERKFPSIIINSKANLYSIDFHAEQYPCAESRISLDETRTRWGSRGSRSIGATHLGMCAPSRVHSSYLPGTSPRVVSAMSNTTRNSSRRR